MNLYLVKCVSGSKFTYEYIEIYVVAQSPTDAQNAALELMRTLQYKFDNRVDEIKLLASVNTYKAANLLVISK